MLLNMPHYSAEALLVCGLPLVLGIEGVFSLVWAPEMMVSNLEFACYRRNLTTTFVLNCLMAGLADRDDEAANAHSSAYFSAHAAISVALQ